MAVPNRLSLVSLWLWRAQRWLSWKLTRQLFLWLEKWRSPRARGKNCQNILASANEIEANFLLFTKRFLIQKMIDCIVYSCLKCTCDSITDVSLPPYRIPHQFHQCSSVNRGCHNQPIRGYTGIQYTGSTLCYNNVYRRSLALAPAPLVFPVYNLTRSLLTAALYYLNAWNRLLSSRNFVKKPSTFLLDNIYI